MHCQCSDTNIYRVVCLIDEGDSFLLTGGRETPTKVSRYTQYSWQEDLSDLNSAHWAKNGGHVTYFVKSNYFSSKTVWMYLDNLDMIFDNS